GAPELSESILRLAIPATLRDSLMARLDRLSDVKEVAQLGACIGREFSYRLIHLVSELENGTLKRGLERLTAAELIFQRGTPPEVTYTFKHSLIQEAAYDSLLKARRTQIHGRIAAALEQHFQQVVDAEPEVIAAHCTAAD